MYYYLDNDRNFQGPYSESALAKWYKSDELPRGMTIYDHKQQGFLIEEIVGKTQKPPTKVIFDDTMILDKTIDQTNLDVTINMNNTFRPCDSTMFQPDFTQIDDDVDEVECGRRAENDRGFGM
uniref:GYF domain-containing protein n=1 Tax=Caenorhabditis japonica TaxID=281687 RepID=A0A8R1ED81_CAEJA